MRAALFPSLGPSLALALCLAGTAGHAATVQVTIQGVRNDTGHVLVALCTKAEFLHPHCIWRGLAPASQGDVHITIAHVPPGIYAAQAFHDENNNAVLDRNILGLPREAMGFSNDAPMRMGPPSFDNAAFRVGDTVTDIVFRLKYF